MSQNVQSWIQNLNPDNSVPEPTSSHAKREQDRMEILIFLLKLSTTGFFC